MEVRFENIDKQYGEFYAVRDVSLTIEDGSLHFLLGPSGCGKTTCLRMLAGLEPVTRGKILFNGKDVTTQPAAERGIGMVFQNYALWPHMTVAKNIEYGLKLRKLGATEVNRRLVEVLDFTQLTTFKDRFPGQLSGGQQQRVALARALAIRPNVLLLDEPLSNLDAKLRLEMRDNISRIHKQTGITTVYVTHDQKEALSMGTHVTVMRAGKLIQSDAPRALYHTPHTPFIADFIGEANLLLGTYKGKKGQLHQVETRSGTFLAARAIGNFKEGEDVTISVRPETISVHFQPSTELENKFEVTLEHLTYLGELEQFQFRTKAAETIRAAVFNPPEHTLVDGSSISFDIKADNVLVLPREHDMTSGT